MKVFFHQNLPDIRKSIALFGCSQILRAWLSNKCIANIKMVVGYWWDDNK
jgi:hypothetical protein